MYTCVHVCPHVVRPHCNIPYVWIVYLSGFLRGGKKERKKGQEGETTFAVCVSHVIAVLPPPPQARSSSLSSCWRVQRIRCVDDEIHRLLMREDVFRCAFSCYRRRARAVVSFLTPLNKCRQSVTFSPLLCPSLRNG